MKRFRTWALLLLLVAGVLPTGYAQDAPSFNIRFRTYPLNGGDFSGLFYLSGSGEMKPVTFLRNRGIRSREHTYAGESPLRFYRMKPDAEGVDVPVEVASVTLDGGVRDYLLFFAQRPEPTPAGEAFQIFKMNDDLDRFPSGKLVFFNAYPDTLYIVFGKERIRIQPGQFSGPYTLPTTETESVTVGMLKVGEDGNPVTLLHNRWRFSPGSRELIVLANDGKSEKPAIYQLTQTR